MNISARAGRSESGATLDAPTSKTGVTILTRMRAFTQTRSLCEGAWLETTPSYAAQTMAGVQRTLGKLAGPTPSDDGPEAVEAALRDDLGAVVATCNACKRIVIDIIMPNGALADDQRYVVQADRREPGIECRASWFRKWPSRFSAAAATIISCTPGCSFS